MHIKEVIKRIEAAMLAARAVLEDFSPGNVEVMRKEGGDPVTEADHRLDQVLKQTLLQGNEGWLSEETYDDRARLEFERVWIVDPLDGTKEFIKGIPEWSVSIGYAVAGKALAGGIWNPVQDIMITGGSGEGVKANGTPVRVSQSEELQGARVLASRSEIKRGEWEDFSDLEVVPCGSVAWKLGRVAAGSADSTWTLTPKNEWDVAAGCALVEAAGGKTFYPNGDSPKFNQKSTKLPGLVAAGPKLCTKIKERLRIPVK